MPLESTTRRVGRTSKWLEDNPSNPTDPYSVTIGTIAGIRDRLKTDELISFQDINAIRDLLTQVRDHNHTYQDYQAIQDFGNNGPGTVGPTTRTTTVGLDPGGGQFLDATNFLEAAGSWSGIDFKSEGIVYAADRNTLRTGYTRIRIHFHRLSDDFYYTSRDG